MPTTHDVVQGEYLALIALLHGFRDSRVIWDHPDNADLRSKRRNPNVLLPGDRLVIPDRTSGLVEAATGKVNPFVAGDDAPRLNVDFEDASAKPLANRDGPLTLGGKDAAGAFVRAKALNTSTDGSGQLQQEFKGSFADRAAATEADFQMLAQPTAPASEFRLLIGDLDPVDEPSGQRARLDNLGYFAGYTEHDRDQLEWATEEFQCDEKLKDRGLFDDRKKNLPTWNHLGKRHGDLLPGEEVS
jgi:hypothetical protein